MNIFDKVTVTLTEHGKKIMDDYIKKLEKETGIEFKSPYINDNNDIIIHLWNLMYIFGADMYETSLGGETPFKDNEINCGENYKSKNLEKEKDIQHLKECTIMVLSRKGKLHDVSIHRPSLVWRRN